MCFSCNYNSINTTIFNGKNHTEFGLWATKSRFSGSNEVRRSRIMPIFPASLAEAALIEKGEELEWLVEDRNTIVLRRVKEKKSFVKEETPLS